MSDRLSAKKILLPFAAFVAAVVGAFLLVFVVLFNLAGPSTLDETDRDFRAMERFFRGAPVQLIDSYLLDGSWAGDVEKAFSARISGMDTELLWQQAGVVRGDRLTEELEAAVNFIGNVKEWGSLDWFPSQEEIHRDSHYVYPIDIVMQGADPDAVRLIVMRPFDDMAFFAYLKI